MASFKFPPFVPHDHVAPLTSKEHEVRPVWTPPLRTSMADRVPAKRTGNCSNQFKSAQRIHGDSNWFSSPLPPHNYEVPCLLFANPYALSLVQHNDHPYRSSKLFSTMMHVGKEKVSKTPSLVYSSGDSVDSISSEEYLYHPTKHGKVFSAQLPRTNVCIEKGDTHYCAAQSMKRISSIPEYHGSVPSSNVSFSELALKASSATHETKRESKPQSFRDDPQRSARVKTELCANYSAGILCPFGAKCSYAHGKHELQHTTLMDMHRSGLIDIKTYRARPCFNFVSTGSCPFGKRCSSMHDPRIEGSSESWLPHAELQVNNLDTNVNVDYHNHQRVMAIHNGNPFENFLQETLVHKKYDRYCNKRDEELKKNSGWKAFQDAVCCTAVEKIDTDTDTQRFIECQRLEIVLLMLGDCNNQNRYKYQPSHIVFNELCMIVQTEAFDVSRSNMRSASSHRGANQTKTVTGIPLNQVDAMNPNHIVVREISFGPIFDPNAVRPTALWFGINDEDVIVCSTQQAKRHRRTRKRLAKQQQLGHEPESEELSSLDDSCFDDAKKIKSFYSVSLKSFDFIPSNAIQPFYLCRPSEQVAFRLTTAIVRHRLETLLLCTLTNDKVHSVATAALLAEKIYLKATFFGLLEHCAYWDWPVNKGRELVNDDTAVPPAEGLYHVFPTNFQYFPAEGGVPSVEDQHTTVGYLWQSFIGSINQSSYNVEDCQSKSRSRLQIFQALFEGSKTDTHNTERENILYLKNIGMGPMRPVDGSCLSTMSESEQCWRDILCSYSYGNAQSDWQKVKAYYQERHKGRTLGSLKKAKETMDKSIMLFK